MHHRESRHVVVVDLGFGDAGKGTLTDFLVRDQHAGLVVRYNGGAQAGHNVVTPDGRHHTFSQFGAGTLAPSPARTHLTADVIVDPLALLWEARMLEGVGVDNPLRLLTIDEDALVITPCHRAANHLRELARGDSAHGTCGVGVGETKEDSLVDDESRIIIADLWRPQVLRSKLARVRERKRALARDLSVPRQRGREALDVLDDPGVDERWLEALSPLRDAQVVTGAEQLERLVEDAGTVVWEGAQGVLLDEWRGFHPHTTWSTCTTSLADRALEGLGVPGDHVTRLGVLRSYATRHGAGPLPSHSDELHVLKEPHNASEGWQGTFRRGWFDLVLARYALQVCPVDALALTHLDALAKATPWGAVVGYDVAAGDEALFKLDRDGRARTLRAGTYRDLVHQRRLTDALGRVAAVWETAPGQPRDWTAWVEDRLGVDVRLVSQGRTTDDKRWR